MRKYALYGTGLIALYLLVVYYTGAVKVENAASRGGVGFIKAFQGR